MGKNVFDIPAAQSWIRRYVDTLIYGKYNQLITNVATNRPIFFAKMKKNSTAIFNLKVAGPSMGGTICMAVSVGETNDLSHSSLSILSTSIPAFFNSSTVYLATSVDGLVSDYVFIGFSVVMTGTFDVSMQAVSSERRGVIGVAYSVSLSTVPNVMFPVSDGYLAGYPLIKPIRSLDAFHRWNVTYQYQAEDPAFFNGSAYFANPASLPNVGESPATHPGKWIQLARPDSGPIDLTEGAKTPQLFYSPGLIISNTNAKKLRANHQDQGMQYPSMNSKVYHFDGDLLDQDQLNPLSLNIKGPEFDFNDVTVSEFQWNDIVASEFPFNQLDETGIFPHYVSEDSIPEPPVTPEPIIRKKPFKEIAEAYYGSFCVNLIMPDNNGQNVLDYWFKLAETGRTDLIHIELPTGELFDMNLGAEEPFWNDNIGVPAPDNFPFNENVILPGTVVYNERNIHTGLVAQQGYSGVGVTVDFNYPDQILPQPNIWNHLSINLGLDQIRIYLNGQSRTFNRLSSGFGGDTKIIINPQIEPIMMDELMFDWTTSISFGRYDEISQTRLPWAYHEWKDGWLTLYADDPDKFDSNLALFVFPVGSVISQATINGIYNASQTPWERFHNFTQDQFELQGEISPIAGNGEKTRFWQRVF
jgi:hypothetical protein